MARQQADHRQIEFGFPGTDLTVAVSQNDYDPGLLSHCVRASFTAADKKITGLVAPSPVYPKLLVVCNVGANDFNLANDNVNSTAANRILCPGSVDYLIAVNEGVTLIYDVTSTRWRIVAAEAGGGGGETDHGALTGLTDDDHSQYPLLAGRSGGQSLIGSVDASEDLTLSSTSHATKGAVDVAGVVSVDEATGQVGVGTTAPDTTVDAGALNPKLTVEVSANEGDPNIVLRRQSTNTPAQAIHARARGTAGSEAVVQSGDTLMDLSAAGYDGDEYRVGAQVRAIVEGTPANNDIRAKLVMRTADGGGLTDRITVSSDGGLVLHQPGTFVLESATMAELTGDVDDYVLSMAAVVRLSADNPGGSRVITGIDSDSGGDAGRTHMLINVGTTGKYVALAHEDALSAAANRIFCPDETNLILQPGEGCWIWYDGTSQRWRVPAEQFGGGGGASFEPAHIMVPCAYGHWIVVTGEWQKSVIDSDTGHLWGRAWNNGVTPAQNDECKTSFRVPATGTYKAIVVGARTSAYGICHVLIGASEKGTVDFYNTSVEYNYTGEVDLGSLTANTEYFLHLKHASKNASSSGYQIDYQHIEIVRTA